jgi:diguanylate cyclase (GGDEF)-like protein
MPELHAQGHSCAHLRTRVERHRAELEQRLGRPVAIAAAAADFAHLTGALSQPVLISQQHYTELQRRCTVDAKTGLLNFGAFSSTLRDELNRAERYGHPVSLIMMDIDGLKRVNDEQGHLEGDAAIMRLVSILRSTVRASDICARYGGDEFAVVLPHTCTNRAQQTATRILEKSVAELAPWRAGLSLGVAGWPDAGYVATELIRAADRALYRSKRQGGCRVTVWALDSASSRAAISRAG